MERGGCVDPAGVGQKCLGWKFTMSERQNPVYQSRSIPTHGEPLYHIPFQPMGSMRSIGSMPTTLPIPTHVIHGGHALYAYHVIPIPHKGYCSHIPYRGLSLPHAFHPSPVQMVEPSLFSCWRYQVGWAVAFDVGVEVFLGLACSIAGSSVTFAHGVSTFPCRATYRTISPFVVDVTLGVSLRLQFRLDSLVCRLVHQKLPATSAHGFGFLSTFSIQQAGASMWSGTPGSPVSS